MTELEPGWIQRQLESAKRDTAMIGGSWEPVHLLAHAERQQERIDRLQAHLDLLMAACQPLLDTEDAAKARAKRMAELAALARTDHAEALRRKSQLDTQPRVTDVGDCCRNIRAAMRKIKKGRKTIPPTAIPH